MKWQGEGLYKTNTGFYTVQISGSQRTSAYLDVEYALMDYNGGHFPQPYVSVSYKAKLLVPKEMM